MKFFMVINNIDQMKTIVWKGFGIEMADVTLLSDSEISTTSWPLIFI